MRIAVTGAGGLLGWHAGAQLHARACAARFRGESPPIEMALLDRVAFNDPTRLGAALDGADAVLHFAGVNRASPDYLEAMNPAIAETLAAACRAAGITPMWSMLTRSMPTPTTLMADPRPGPARSWPGSVGRIPTWCYRMSLARARGRATTT